MAENGFRSIRLKGSVLDAVEDFIAQHPEMGYKGMADFVTDAVREKLLELKTQIATAAQPPAAVQEGEA